MGREIFGPEFIITKLDQPNDISIYVSFWAEQGKNLEHALEIAEHMVIEYPDDLNMCSSLAEIYIKLGKEKEALEAYGEDKVKHLWEDAGTLNNYAWFWALEGKNLKHAKSASERSLELEPKNANYWDTLAMVEWKLKNYKEAIKAQEKALELNPGTKSYLDRIEQIKAEMKENK